MTEGQDLANGRDQVRATGIGGLEKEHEGQDLESALAGRGHVTKVAGRGHVTKVAGPSQSKNREVESPGLVTVKALLEIPAIHLKTRTANGRVSCHDSLCILF